MFCVRPTSCMCNGFSHVSLLIYTVFYIYLSISLLWWICMSCKKDQSPPKLGSIPITSFPNRRTWLGQSHAKPSRLPSLSTLRLSYLCRKFTRAKRCVYFANPLYSCNCDSTMKNCVTGCSGAYGFAALRALVLSSWIAVFLFEVRNWSF